MDIKRQLIAITESFKACFTVDRLLALRIVLFIFTGLTALWLYIVDCILLFIISLFQAVGRELHLFISDEKKPGPLRAVMLIAVYPITLFRYVLVPIFNMIFYIVNFFFNCFCYAVSLGKSGWKGMYYEGEAQPSEIES